MYVFQRQQFRPQNDIENNRWSFRDIEAMAYRLGTEPILLDATVGGYLIFPKSSKFILFVQTSKKLLYLCEIIIVIFHGTSGLDCVISSFTVTSFRLINGITLAQRQSIGPKVQDTTVANNSFCHNFRQLSRRWANRWSNKGDSTQRALFIHRYLVS